MFDRFASKSTLAAAATALVLAAAVLPSLAQATSSGDVKIAATDTSSASSFRKHFYRGQPAAQTALAVPQTVAPSFRKHFYRSQPATSVALAGLDVKSGSENPAFRRHFYRGQSAAA